MYFRSSPRFALNEKELSDSRMNKLDNMGKSLLSLLSKAAFSISFVATIENIERLVSRLDSLSSTLMKADEHVFFGKILNLFK